MFRETIAGNRAWLAVYLPSGVVSLDQAGAVLRDLLERAPVTTIPA